MTAGHTTGHGAGHTTGHTTGHGAGHVAAHLAALEAALPGPARGKRALLDEARDGLDDAAAAHRGAGLDPAEAECRAVLEFGAVADVAPAFAEEIAVAQTRRTSRVLCVMLPALVLVAHGLLLLAPGAPRPHAQLVLAGHLAGVVALTVVTGVAALALTSRPVPGTSDRLPAVVGTVVGAVAVLAGLVVSGGAAALLFGHPVAGPAPAALAVITVVGLATTSWSGLACRRTAAGPTGVTPR